MNGKNTDNGATSNMLLKTYLQQSGATLVEFVFSFTLIVLFVGASIEISYFLLAKSIFNTAMADEFRKATYNIKTMEDIRMLAVSDIATAVEARVNQIGPFHLTVIPLSDVTEVFPLEGQAYPRTCINNVIEIKLKAEHSCIFCVGDVFSSFNASSLRSINTPGCVN